MKKNFKMLFIALMIGVVVAPMVASAAPRNTATGMSGVTLKPKSSWQISLNSGYLTVYTGELGSSVYFSGMAEDYDGSATSPASISEAYRIKQERLKIEDYEALRAK